MLFNFRQLSFIFGIKLLSKGYEFIKEVEKD